MTAVVQGVPGWVRTRMGDRVPGQGVVRVLRALAVHPRGMAFASTAEAAGLAEVNVATVVRAAQLLGFSGWPALRAEMRSRYLSGLSASQVLNEHATTSEAPAWAALRRDLRNLQELSQMLDPVQIDRVAQVLHRSQVTVVLGSGSFAAPGLQLSHIGQTIGHDIRLHRTGGTALLNAVSLLTPRDSLVLFHLWRSPREVMNAVRVAAAAGVTVLVVSDRTTDELLEMVQELVLVPSEGVSMFPSLTASMAVVHGVLASLVTLDEDAARTASDHVESLWTAYGLFPSADESD